MWGLLASTVLTSAVDSLNPIAITQQFVLQGMVKKPKHIWYFIIPTGIVNYIGGILAYIGLIALIGDFFGGMIKRYGQFLFVAELILGIVFLIAAGLLIQNNKMETLKKEILSRRSGADNDSETDEAKTGRSIKSVSPAALVVLGVSATISELMTALPYFAFLAILFHYRLAWFPVAVLLLVYNIIYMSPLMLLYFIYIKAQNRFDRLYTVIKREIKKWANILAPTLAGIIGIVLIYHSMSYLLQ